MHISSSYAKILSEKLFRTWEFPRSGSKVKNGENTPGTAGGPGGRDRMLAVKSRKNVRKITFLSKKNKIYQIFFIFYYWVKNYFAHGRFPEVGQKQKTERERKRD